MPGDDPMGKDLADYLFLHRKLKQWPLYHDIPCRCVMVELLLTVVWKPYRMFFNGEWVDLQPGEITTTFGVLAKQAHLTKMQIRRAIELMQKEGTIVTRSVAHRLQVVTLCNWKTYQPDANSAQHGDDTKNSTVAARSQHGRNTLKEEGKKGRREEEEESISNEMPTGVGPLFQCKDIKLTQLTQYEYDAIVATIGCKSTADLHLLHWAARSHQKAKPWLCNRTNLVEHLVKKWNDAKNTPTGQSRASPDRSASHERLRQAEEEFLRRGKERPPNAQQ